MTNKTNKSGRNALAGKALLIALICMLGLATACDNGSNDSTKPWDTATVEFVALVAGETLDFSPSAALPKGVTYVLTDDKGNTWNSESFNGQVSANTYDTAGNVTFTQTFYLNGEKLTGAGSQRTVTVVFDTFPDPYFMVIISDSGSVTLVHP
jgi:hypothetical protein